MAGGDNLLSAVTPSQAAAALGRIKTERKTASSRLNAAKAAAARRGQRKSLCDVQCSCGVGPVLDKAAHSGTCRLYQAIYYREKKGLPVE